MGGRDVIYTGSIRDGWQRNRVCSWGKYGWRRSRKSVFRESIFRNGWRRNRVYSWGKYGRRRGGKVYFVAVGEGTESLLSMRVCFVPCPRQWVPPWAMAEPVATCLGK